MMEDLRDAFSGNLNPPFEATVSEVVKDSVSTNDKYESLGDELDAFLSDADSLKSLNFTDGPLVIKPRPYQNEMFEESLERNIIIAMDTGSGKTHIAVMRMQLELERIPSHQIIWFLAPTVALCEQQHENIQLQITSVQIKLLSGADGVDRWTNQTHWDAVLKNIKIVVSPYQILLDALSNGFVQMESLALIVFDEAHNCVSKHPGAKIMSLFYHGRKESGLRVPHILGMTASPVMRSNAEGLKAIETTLDSICRTPKKHRADLRLEVKLPVLLQVQYQSLSSDTFTKAIISLRQALSDMKVTDDPYFLSLVKDKSERGRRKLDKVRMNHKTWCHDQMKTFCSTALKIYQDLGAWAADYYISQVVMKIKKAATGSRNFMDVWDLSAAEKRYLAKILEPVQTSSSTDLSLEELHLVSDKVSKLIEVLLQETASFRGIVFVQERATTAILSHLLSVHPTTRGRYKIGTIVGTSAHSYRARNLSELIDLDEQKHTLSKFKSGQINLAIATSVLEEGIDVPACNLVICFQTPANLKSFVQRRGRARHRDSKLVLLLGSGDKKVVGWEQLESDMRKMYEDEMRTLQEFMVHEDTEEHDGRTFQVKSTNATLDLDNAIAKLYHFCAKLPSTAYVDRRPEFICSNDGTFIQAKVVLPLSVDETIRVVESQRFWMSEKNAIKDAAFQAYVALYQAGLVNDNLLPTVGDNYILADLRASATDTRASLVTVGEQLNPWIEVSRAWKSAEVFHACTLVFHDTEVVVLLPVRIPDIPPIHLYWDSATEFILEMAPRTCSIDPDTQTKAVEETWALLHSAFAARFPVAKGAFVMQFALNHDRPLNELMGKQDIPQDTQLHRLRHMSGLIRHKVDQYVAYSFNEVLSNKPDISLVQNPYDGYSDAVDSIHVSLTKLPRRSDFLHKLPPSSIVPSTKPYPTVLPLDRCTVDEMPLMFYQFGRLIPSIMYRIEKYLLASILSNTILKDVEILDLTLVATAITASSAADETNYQRLEFLGDTILKMCTSVQLIAEYPLWHEGYLTEMKGRIVSNSNLYTAAVSTGLDKFIITKAFNGHKWRPLYVDDLLKVPTEGQREMSSKIPADVVESLIGASMLDGGIPKALKCLRTFIPRLEWQPLEARQAVLYQRTPDVELPATMQPLEDLIGYRFRNKGLLVEAMTHASCHSGSASLERLEFLGDAILDHLVVAQLWKYDLSHMKMHLMRTALVNADVLAFLCMEWSTEHEVIDLENSNSSGPEGNSLLVIEKPRTVSLAFWMLMRHTSPQVSFEQRFTTERHAIVAPSIRTALQSGTHYPWALLARLQAQKFYSDIVESLIAAVWIDSGSFDVCNEVVERIGIFSIMRRMLSEGVQVLNPKEELSMLADSETVKYVVSRPSNVIGVDGEERSKGLVCKVLVGDREVICVESGVSIVEVETRAAEEAVKILKEGRMDGVVGDGSGGPVNSTEGELEIHGDEGGENDKVDVEMGDA